MFLVRCKYHLKKLKSKETWFDDLSKRSKFEKWEMLLIDVELRTKVFTLFFKTNAMTNG